MASHSRAALICCQDPLMTVIKVSAIFRRDLQRMLPALLWNATATSWDGKQGPIVHLGFTLDSYCRKSY